MNRLVIATGTVAMLLLVACGSSAAGASASASSSGSSSGAGGAGGLGRNGAAGELVQINGTALILNTTTGDVAVQFTSTTPVTKTSTGTVADIVTGACVAITGTKDATGTITANNVRLSDAVNGACPAGRGPGGGGPGGGVGGGTGTGTGSRSGTSTGTGSGSGGGARPTPPANLASARGPVTAVTGTSVTVQDTTGAPVTVTVPTTVQVSRSSTALPSDLAVGDCVAAIGTKDTSGTVTARSLSVVPAGPSGCFTGGGGRGFGGFGGGRGGGGVGGGGGSASATGTGG